MKARTHLSRISFPASSVLVGPVLVAVLALGVLPFAAWAQVGGPVLGYVPDRGSIRPVYGIPAAAAVMGPIDPGRAVSLMAVSPHQDFVLATAADTGGALLIRPGVSTTTLDAVAAGPDSITMSPSGSAAILWWNSVSNFQVVSGLPDSPAVLRTVNTSFLGAAPAALAVSDDGQWVAGLWSTGVYAFGPDGQMNQLPVQGAAALAFFHQRTDLALASAAQISTVTDVGGAAASTLIYDSSVTPGAAPLAPMGIALSFDNRRMVVADRSGTVMDIDLSTNVPTSVNCGCTPKGLFGMNGTVFRLTDPRAGALKLFDAATGDVYFAPPVTLPLPAGNLLVGLNASATDRYTHVASAQIGYAASLPPAPTVTVTPTAATPGQQLPVNVSISGPYPLDINGTITLSFASSVGGDDQLIAFSIGGRTLNFSFSAGSTILAIDTPVFSTTSSGVSLLTGTVAGTITLTTTITAQGVLLTPQPTPVQIVINPTPPVIMGVSISEPAASNVFTVVVTGFSDTRDMTSGLFHFAPTSGHTLAQSDITVPLSSAFATWYQNPASNAYGSEFTLTVPFTVQGATDAVVAVTVTLTNSKGVSTTSNPANP